MKIATTILLFLLALAGIGWYFVPTMDPEVMRPRTDLPWQVEALENGESRVFDMVLGRATLADAQRKFGRVDGIAVYRHKDGSQFLEAYFPDVRLGLLKAKAVVGLVGTDARLETLKRSVNKPTLTSEGDTKYPLPVEMAGELADLRVSVITFIPGTRKLDAAFFRERLGEPARVRRDSDHAVTWFYPAIGLGLLIDDDGGEAMEFVPPRDFRLPGDVD